MKKNTIVFISYILCIYLLGSCQNTQNIHSETSKEGSSLTFEELEEIVDNQPEKYLNNPDSFLNSTNLHPKNATENETYAYSLILMAYNIREHGNIFKSIQYYEKALNFVKEKNLQTIDIDLYILKPLAALYINVNDNQKAINLLEDLLRSISPTKYSQRSGYVNNLANANIFNGETQKAIEILLPQIENTASSINKALLLNTLSKAYDTAKNKTQSEKYNSQAIHEFEKYELRDDTLIWYCSALTQYAELHQSVNEVRKAITILNTDFPNTEFRNKANAFLILANISFEKEETQEAQDNFRQAFRHFRQNESKYILDYKYTYALLGLARTYSKLNNVDSASFYYEWAIENDFRTQQLITSETDQLRNNIWNKNLLEELIQLYQNNKNEQSEKFRETIFWCVELSKARLLINEINRSENWSSASDDVKKAVQQIRLLYQKQDASNSAQEKQSIAEQIAKLKNEFQLSESYFETINFNPSKQTFLERIHDDNNAYYSYYVHQDKSLSILYNKDKNLVYETQKDANFIHQINNFKSTYFSDSPNTFNNSPKQYIEQAKSLCQVLLPQLDQKKGNVFISLDGSLYGLPFDALYNQNYLVLTHNFAYLNSFLLFDFITNNKPSKSKEISLLYRSQFPKPLPNLQFVKEEVQSLTTKFKTLAIDPAHQNDSTIREAFARTNIIHIAAHTILDSIEAPYLYLHQAISTNQLRFFEIKTPLVFLSACNTGSGKPLPSEGTESIQRVFMSKNVPSVISTYWFANDEVMLAMTESFYDQLLQHQDPILALANAKRNFLQNASIQQQNPWYWANINYTGIGNEIGLKTNSNLFLWICLGSITLVVLLLFIRRLHSNKSLIKKN